MKTILFLLFPICLFSQNNCFDDGKKSYSSKSRLLNIKDTFESILFSNPKHIKFKENGHNLSYEKDENSEFEEPLLNEPFFWEKRKAEHEKKFANFILYFGEQFRYIQLQKEKKNSYAIAENSFGCWLLEISDKKPKAYYIGFSKNTYINRNQKENFIKNNTLYLDGSFITRERRIRFYETEVVKDFLTFEVHLDDIKKDSDNDGYNDFFENLVFLNPDSKDTDGDGISDFDDLNPLHKSENNKFANLYKEIIEKEQNFNDLSDHYSFETYESDCEYFQRINPEKERVLIWSSSQAYKMVNDYNSFLLRTFYGKIKKTEDENVFYIPYHYSSQGGKIIATYKNGKWSIYQDLEYKA